MNKIIVYHGGYGCDSGCCGHWVILSDDHSAAEEFSFTHPDDGMDPKEFAKTLIREEFGEDHIKDLDWENCIIKDYSCH